MGGCDHTVAMNVLQPFSPGCAPCCSCAPPCRPEDIPAVTLPRKVSLAPWWRMLVEIAAALAEPWDVGGEALASWLPGTAKLLWSSGKHGFHLNTCAWHRIGNQCRKGYEDTHKFWSIANLGLGEAVFHLSPNRRKQYQSHWKDEEPGDAIVCVHS